MRSWNIWPRRQLVGNFFRWKRAETEGQKARGATGNVCFYSILSGGSSWSVQLDAVHPRLVLKRLFRRGDWSFKLQPPQGGPNKCHGHPRASSKKTLMTHDPWQLARTTMIIKVVSNNHGSEIAFCAFFPGIAQGMGLNYPLTSFQRKVCWYHNHELHQTPIVGIMYSAKVMR